MTLSLHHPFPPMEAMSVDEVPEGKDWQYEPKWDGFRCLIFRGGEKVELQSKSGQSLTRYFPELVETVRSIKARQFVLDGEIVVPRGRSFSFDDLLQRIHPAASRVKRLAAETPALLLRPSGGCRWSAPHQDAAQRKAHIARTVHTEISAWQRIHPAVTDHHQARRCQKMAQTGRGNARRHHRKAPRRVIRIRQSPRYAEDQKLPHGGLRRRRVLLQ